MNFLDLQTEVFTKLSESQADPAYFEASDIKESLNDAYEEMSDASEWYERNFTIRCLSGRTYYDLRYIVDETVLGFKSAFNNNTKRWLEPIDLRELDYRTYRQWEGVTGEPRSHFMRGLWWYGVFPKQPSDSGSIKLYFTSLPPSLSADSDEPGFPDDFHPGLVEYAVGDLLAQQGLTKPATPRFQKYLSHEKELSKWVDERISLDRVNRLNG